MKIAVITHHIPSTKAHSINTMKSAQGFYKLGHNVEILIVRRLNEALNKLKINGIYQFYGINRSIKYKYFTDKSFLFFKEGKYLRGYSNHLTKLLKKLIPRLDEILDPERKISKYCKENNFDFVFCRGTYKILYYNIINKVPTIMDLHGYIPLLDKFVKLSKSKYFKGIITLNNLLKQKYIKLGFSGDKIKVIENAVDLTRYNKIIDDKRIIRKKLNLPLNKIIILYSGLIANDRGIDTILNAAKSLNNESYSFYFIGKGREKNTIRKWKKYKIKNNINADINFLGWKERVLVPYYLKAADVLLATFSSNCPSINYMSPTKLIEYMSTKTPIIATKIGRNIEICTNNECLFTNPDDSQDLSEKIKLLTIDEDLKNELIKNAFILAKSYTIKKRCKKILELINK